MIYSFITASYYTDENVIAKLHSLNFSLPILSFDVFAMVLISHYNTKT